jgi:hypothetical protein
MNISLSDNLLPGMLEMVEKDIAEGLTMRENPCWFVRDLIKEVMSQRKEIEHMKAVDASSLDLINRQKLSIDSLNYSLRSYKATIKKIQAELEEYS